MKISARLNHVPAADRRTSPRRKLELSSSLEGTGDSVTIHDFSVTGMLMETAGELKLFNDLEIDLPEIGITTATVVWNSGRYYGCEFNEPVSQMAVSAALLRGAPARPIESAAPPAVAEPTASTNPEPVIEQAPCEPLAEYEKASLTVRLRVIFGSAILLWALIISAVRWLVS